MLELVKEHAKNVAIVLALAALFTFLNIYGTGGMSTLERFGMWTVTIGLGALASLFVAPQIFDKDPYAQLSASVQIVIAAAIIAIPVTAGLLVIEAMDGAGTPLAYWPLQFCYVYVIALVVTGAGYLLNQYRESKAAEAGMSDEGAAQSDPTEAFFARLPPKLRGAELYGVSSEDHYLRIHTSLGEELVLMRLADAEALLSNADGQRVHRSWWVARDGVAQVLRKTGKIVLELKSGARAPVSRTYQKAARDGGLLD